MGSDRKAGTCSFAQREYFGSYSLPDCALGPFQNQLIKIGLMQLQMTVAVTPIVNRDYLQREEFRFAECPKLVNEGGDSFHIQFRYIYPNRNAHHFELIA